MATCGVNEKMGAHVKCIGIKYTLWGFIDMDDEKLRQLSEEQYKEQFSHPEQRKYALELALDIRKFEIQLYWTRTAYFWTFIAAAIGGYGAVQTLSDPTKTDLSMYLSCMGIVLSFAWHLANRGSKQWQENWENHVDLLEDFTTGPLYKITLARPPRRRLGEKIEHAITGPSPYSVSKINQVISLYAMFLWVFFLWRSIGFSKFSQGQMIAIGFTVLACLLLVRFGGTHRGSHNPVAFLRETKVTPANNNDVVE